MAEQDEIQAMYQQLIDGWNAGSGEAFAAPFSENADFVAFDGTRFKGRAEIAAFTKHSSRLTFGGPD